MEKGHQVCYQVSPCVTRILFPLKAVRRPLAVVTQGMFKSGNSNAHAAMDILKYFKVTE